MRLRSSQKSPTMFTIRKIRHFLDFDIQLEMLSDNLPRNHRQHTRFIIPEKFLIIGSPPLSPLKQPILPQKLNIIPSPQKRKPDLILNHDPGLLLQNVGQQQICQKQEQKLGDLANECEVMLKNNSEEDLSKTQQQLNKEFGSERRVISLNSKIDVGLFEKPAKVKFQSSNF